MGKVKQIIDSPIKGGGWGKSAAGGRRRVSDLRQDLGGGLGGMERGGGVVR